MSRQTVPFGAASAVDLAELGCGDFRFHNSYDSASRLEWMVTAAEQTMPFSKGDFVIFWDDDVQSESSPLFEGYVEEVTPGGNTSTVKVVAYDPTYRATKTITCMSAPWEYSSGVVEGAAAYPRFIANCNIESDDDYAYSVIEGGTVGQIVKAILDYQQEPLYAVNATPGSGSPSGSSACYVSSEIVGNGLHGDLQVGGIEFVPQEKIVATSESVNSLIDRVLSQYEPAWRQTWVPGERRFRFASIDNLDEASITVNDPEQTYPVLNLRLTRSLEGRYTAVQFYGPEAVEWRTALCSYPPDAGDTLEDTSDFGTIGTIPNTGTCHHHWTITDPEFTRVARRGNSPVQVPSPVSPLYGTNSAGDTIYVGAEVYMDWWYPHLQVQYPDNEGGDDSWYMVGGWNMDARNGTVFLLNSCLYRWDEDASGSSIVEPDFVKFVYPNMVGPLTVRYPETGYQGTAYTVAGLESTLRIYDEQLATGYDYYGVPVTDEERRDKFSKLAQSILKERQDIIYAGGATLDGLDYSWKDLRKAVNFLALDDDGDPLTTGWEEVGAILTEVEYDFEDRTTTLGFSTDKFELVGIDAEQLKREMQIRDPQQMVMVTEQAIIVTSQNNGVQMSSSIDLNTLSSINRTLGGQV